jgi:hypothetical protein
LSCNDGQLPVRDYRNIAWNSKGTMAVSVDTSSGSKDICFINFNYSNETIKILGTI